MRTKRSVYVLSALSLLLFNQVSLADGAPQQMPAPKADVYVVPAPKDLPILLKYPAQLHSYQNINVVSRVSGVLQKQHFDEGSEVKAGALLFTIEDTIYKARVDAAKASLGMSEAAMRNASRNWERAQKLYESKSISEEKKDAALFEYEQAKASLSLAQAQLNQAEIDLNYTQVKAPISGFVGLRHVDVGDYVTQAQKLVSITQNDKLYLEFSMPLSDYKNIKSGMWNMPHDAKIGIDIYVDEKMIAQKGEVDFIDANIDQSTSTLKMRAVVKNADASLLAGNFVRVSLNGIAQKNVITIPQKAVLQNPMGTIVFVEQGGVVGIRPVMIGKESGDKYVVAGGPLQSGDRVIVNNFFRVKPGAKVEVDQVIQE